MATRLLQVSAVKPSNGNSIKVQGKYIFSYIISIHCHLHNSRLSKICELQFTSFKSSEYNFV